MARKGTHGCRVRERFTARLDPTFILRPSHPAFSSHSFVPAKQYVSIYKGLMRAARTILIGKTAWNKCPRSCPLTTTINVASYCRVIWRQRVITGRRPSPSSEWIILIDNNSFSSNSLHKMIRYVSVSF